jgi:hypothetical protein
VAGTALEAWMMEQRTMRGIENWLHAKVISDSNLTEDGSANPPAQRDTASE